MAATTTTQVTFISKDGMSFLAHPAIVSARSTVIRDLLEDLGEEASEMPIPISEVNGNILEKVLAWCEHHKDDAVEPQANLGPREVSAWDKEFFGTENEIIFSIIMAANFLDIKVLLETGAKIVADMMKGCTAAEIREKFNLEDDLTPEDLEQIRKENAWAEDR